MKTPEERAQIARENGAKSKGPVTPEGKNKSRRNAIKHGGRADALRLLVPPHSSVLVHEERQYFYEMFDTNVAKYRPVDDHELFIVREITDLQWANLRIRITTNAHFNRELLRTADTVDPLIPEHFEVENTIAACDSLANSLSHRELDRRYSNNVRLIILLERRLGQVQGRWPSQSRKLATTTADRAAFHTPAPERTTAPEPEPVENTEPEPEKHTKIINVHAPLTKEKMDLYRSYYPDEELEFHVYEDKPSAKGASKPKNSPQKAA